MASSAHLNPSTSQIALQSNDEWIPEGYVGMEAPDTQRYIVPAFLLPALEQHFRGEVKKTDCNAFSASGSVSSRYIVHCIFICWVFAQRAGY